MSDKKSLNLDELALCAIFWAGLNSIQFKKLEEKSQVLKMYNQEPDKNFIDFLDFNKLVDTISSIKKGEYVLKIPTELAENESIKRLLQEGKAILVEEFKLEDMFCTFLTSIDKDSASVLLEHFLNTEYYNKDKQITNRFSHSMQVMFASGLTCRTVNADFKDTLTCMIASAFHDIGHVPFAHVMEQTIKIFAGHFSHEINGKNVISKIITEKLSEMKDKMSEYLPIEITEDQIKESIFLNAKQIENGIVEHSRTNSEKRGIGLVVQLPRGSDKIAYSIADLFDYLIKIPKELKSKNELKDFLPNEGEFSQDSNAFKEFYEALKQENFGKAFTIAAASVRPIRHEGKDVYNVNEDIWQYVLQLIKKESVIRQKSRIEEIRSKIEVLSVIALARIAAAKYEENNKDLRTTYQAAIDEITCMGEKDLYDYIKSLSLDKKLQPTMSIRDIRQRLQKGQGETGDLLNIIQNTTDSNSEVSNIRGIIKDEQQKVSYNVLTTLTDDEAKEIFKHTFAVFQQELDLLADIKKGEDVQLKILPSRNRQIVYGFGDEILSALGITSEVRNDIPEHQSLTTTYFEPSNSVDKNQIKVSLTHIQGTNEQTLAVKEKIPKKKKPVFNIKYETTGETSLSIEDMVNQLNNENPNLNLSLESDTPILTLKIDRYLYTRTFKGEELVITCDVVTNEDGSQYPIVEIRAPQSEKVLDKVVELLSNNLGRTIRFTKEGKFEKSSLHKGNPLDPKSEGRDY